MASLVKKQQELEEQLFKLISVEEVTKHVEYLSEKIGVRVGGSTLEYNGAVYLKNVLESYGLPCEIEEFDAYLDRSIESKFDVIRPKRRSVICESLPWCSSTHPDGLTGDLAYAGYGTKEAFKNLDVWGKIVLVNIGKIRRSEKVKNAQDKGAVATITISDWPGNVITGIGSVSFHTGNPVPGTKLPEIPAIGISYEDGQYLQKLLEGNPVTVWMKIIRAREWKKSHNVIATLKGHQRSEEEIVVGAHIDNWGPGAHDSGSQLAGVLELARILSKFPDKIRRTVKFICWGSHEFGTIGSSAYVFEKHLKEMKKVIMNVVAGATLGTKGLKRKTYITRASPELEAFVEDIVVEYGWRAKWRNDYPLWSWDDHTAFFLMGIPTIENDGWYPHVKCYTYHTTGLDTFRHVQIDPDGVRDVIKTMGTALLRVANADVFPYDYSRWTKSIKEELIALQNQVDKDFSYLFEKATNAEEAANKFKKSLFELLRNHEKITKSGKALHSKFEGRLMAFYNEVNKTNLALTRSLVAAVHGKSIEDLRTGMFIMPFFRTDSPILPILMELQNFYEKLAKLNPESEEFRYKNEATKNWILRLINTFENASSGLKRLVTTSIELNRLLSEIV